MVLTDNYVVRYDVKRICSSSTLIGSDLAKRSPKESVSPPALEEYSSTSQPQLGISGEKSDELVDMMWNNGSHRQSENTADEAATASRNSSNPQSPKGTEFGIGGSEFAHGYYASDNGNEEEDNGRMVNLELVHHHVPMFALWNE